MKTDAPQPDNVPAVVQPPLVRHLWVFDCNRRVYVDPETGEKSTGPIYKYGWVKHEIIGETCMSWLYGLERKPIKIPKKGPHHGVAFSEEEVAEKCFVNENADKLSELVRRASYAQLKEIERILSLPNSQDRTCEA